MFVKRLGVDLCRRVHRVLAVLFLLSIPPAAYFSFTGDPLAPHPLVYMPLFPLALMVITGMWMLVRPWIKSLQGRPASATTDKGN